MSMICNVCGEDKEEKLFPHAYGKINGRICLKCCSIHKQSLSAANKICEICKKETPELSKNYCDKCGNKNEIKKVRERLDRNNSNIKYITKKRAYEKTEEGKKKHAIREKKKRQNMTGDQKENYKKQQREYRKKYMDQPEIKEKTKKRMLEYSRTPEQRQKQAEYRARTIEKRKQYAQRPDIRERDRKKARERERIKKLNPEYAKKVKANMRKWVEQNREYVKKRAHENYVKRKTKSFVITALSQPDPPITISRARELLGFEKMEDMRKWMDKNIKNEATK